jgi:uncharacterized iron-regulated membrane protein
MAIKNTNLLIRKTHRYLGLFIGLQFLAWTVSGLYFSWNEIDSVHGDHLRKRVSYLHNDVNVLSPSVAVQALTADRKVDSIHSVHLVRLLNKPVYQLAYFAGHTGEGHHHHLHYALADASTGQLRNSLTQEEAADVAKEQVVAGAQISGVDYLKQIEGGHEYREKPLPAWAVHFKNPDCTVYVSAEKGTFESIRHDQWRAFDFLYMFHTMDYATRDNFNNWLLKILSTLGLVTVLSGFVLFFISSRSLNKIVNR